MTNLPVMYHKQGADKSFTIFMMRDWEPIDITGYEIYFVVRPKKTLPDLDNDRTVIDKLAVIVDAEAGRASLNITREDSIDIPVSQYIYEVSYKKPNDQIQSHYWYWDFEIAYLSNKLG